MGQQQSGSKRQDNGIAYGAISKASTTPARKRASTTPAIRSADLESSATRRPVDDIAIHNRPLRPLLHGWRSDARFLYIEWAEGYDDYYDSSEEEELNEDEEGSYVAPVRKATSFDEGSGGVTVSRACVTFVKSMVGAYILFTPRMYSNGGLLVSALCTVVIAAVSTDNILMLLRAADAAQVHTFGAVGRAAFGAAGQAAVDASLVLSQLGYCTTYFIFVSGNIPAVVPAPQGSWAAALLTPEALILMQMALYIPLSWIRRLKYMAIFMLIANVCMVVGLTMITDVCVDLLVERGPMPLLQFNPNGFILFAGAIVTCFEGIGLVLPIREGVSSEARLRFPAMIVSTMAAITLLYIGFAVMGYATFGADIASFVTESLPASSRAGNAAVIAYCLCIALTFPLQLFPAAKTVEKYLFMSRAGKRDLVAKWRKNFLRASMVVVCGAIALKASRSFDNFAGLIGGVCAVPLALVYPVFFHLKLCGKDVSTLGWCYGISVASIGIAGSVVVTVTSLATWKG